MALPVTVADFRTEFPEFPVSVISDARVSSLLQRAKRLHTATKAGTLYAAAHLHCLDKVSGRDVEGGAAADGGFGVVSKETIGPKSVEYMTTAGESERKAFWATSTYGREFMNLEQRNVRQGFGIIIA